MKAVAVLFVSLGVSGCASAPRVMDYFPVATGEPAVTSWPSAAHVPRLEYAGQLVGEQNFKRAGKVGGGRKFLRWLVGLGDGRGRVNQLVRPQTGIVDSRGRVLVTDGGRPSVFVFDEASASFEIWQEARPGVDFVSPVGIAERAGGGYLVADADLGGVFMFSPEGEAQGRFTADELLRPTGIEVDPQTGNVFVADKDASQVRVYTPDGTLLRSVGVPGTEDGQLNAPMHLRIGGGTLFVSDALNASVQMYSVADGAALGRIGRRGLYVGNLVRPKGVALDGDGNVYVIESYYDHMLIYDPTGRFLLPIGGTGSDVGRFFLPAGAWSDGRDRIFVADMFNARVVVFRYVGAGV